MYLHYPLKVSKNEDIIFETKANPTQINHCNKLSEVVSNIC